jgi:hypothetical protein
VVVFLPVLIGFGDARFWPALVAIALAGLALSLLLSAMASGALRLCVRRPLPTMQHHLRVVHLWLFGVGVFLAQGGPVIDGGARGPLGAAPQLGALAIGAALYALLHWVLKRRPALAQRMSGAAHAFALAGTVFFAVAAQARVPSYVPAPAPQSANELGYDRNIIVLIMDMLPGALLEQTLARHPELASQLEGFTLFSRATSTFPFTTYSLPQIMSGKVFAAGGPRPDYPTNLEAARQGSFVTDALARGYRAGGIVVFPVLPNGMLTWEDDYLESARAGSDLRRGIAGIARRLDDYWQLLLATAYRLTRIEALASLLATPMYRMKEAALEAWRRWRGAIAVGKAPHKVFVMHNMLPHVPMTFDADGRYARTRPWSIDTLQGELRFVVAELGALFARLRELGVFDSALIVVTGDHGHLICSDDAGRPGPEDFADGAAAGGNFRPPCMYNPALLIKLPGSTGFALTRQPASLSDIRPLVLRYLAGMERGASAARVMHDIRASGGPISALLICGARRNPHLDAKEFAFVETAGNVTALPKMFEQACGKSGK